ncbi:MAG TPA: 3D domain-containing protein [Thermoanaerobaculia bacterium]|nr:3D domain-containing protein [Thermoanaerobaculia bacterium]
MATAAVLTMALLPAPPATAASPATIKKAMLSFYWVIDESAPAYRGRAAEVALRDARGHVIATTSRKFRRALVLEGAGRLRDGRVVTYNCKRRGEHRFRLTKAQSGLAVTGGALVPFRTVAVDPRVIKLGSKIYIPQLKGAKLPDGTIHDGIFVAADCGHFRGRHVDIFVGESPRGARPFARRGYGSRSHVTVVVQP